MSAASVIIKETFLALLKVDPRRLLVSSTFPPETLGFASCWLRWSWYPPR